MNGIAPIRSAQLFDIAALQPGGLSAGSGPGGISSEQFEKLASAIQVSAPSTVGAPTGDFSGMLTQMVREVQAKQAAASEAVAGVLGGKGVPLHEAVLAGEEASVSFQLMVEVRNKLLESYQELMRMQV